MCEKGRYRKTYAEEGASVIVTVTVIMMIVTVIMTVITTIIMITLLRSMRHTLVRNWKEWEESSQDKVEKMRSCACYRCRHMCALWDEYAPYAQ